jgi:hypothetical protein
MLLIPEWVLKMLAAGELPALDAERADWYALVPGGEPRRLKRAHDADSLGVCKRCGLHAKRYENRSCKSTEAGR